MQITRNAFGKTPDGEQIDIFTITNSRNCQISIITYGAILQSVKFPDKNGEIAELVLGFDELEGYLGKHPFYGCTVGRFANRIGKAKFILDGKEYNLAKNDGNNHLHGGLKGFGRAVWEAFPLKRDNSASVKLAYASPDGEDNYPGNMDIAATYTLTEENEIIVEWEAVCDRPSPVNITNHAYWNLRGKQCSAMAHRIKIFADKYLPMDNESIPLGRLEDVKGGPMDFLDFKEIGKDIEEAGGYDHCFVINPSEASPAKAAIVEEPESGRKMEVFTTQPGMHFYSGNYLEGSAGRNVTQHKRDAFCLETEDFPDSPNKPNFPNCILRPGETYKHKAVYKLGLL